MAKCPVCRGKGYRLRIDDMRFAMAEIVKCESCDGKGVVKPLTEQEYIQTCNTEQLAEFLHGIVIRAVQATWDGKKPDYPAYLYDWKMWLKQPHTESGES